MVGAETVRDLARHHGFVEVRLARVGPTPRADFFQEWLSAGHWADMAWLPRGAAIRCDPRRRAPDAKTAVVLAVPHHEVRPPDPGGLTGKVARYAWGRDYHNLVGKRLRKLRRDLRALGIACWGGVDTAPILERAWAEAAGLGFTGKSCVQILPGKSSWFFLAVLFIDIELPHDEPIVRDHCGTCRACLVSCPTQAFVAPWTLDARRCISYWTIEARGLPPRALRRGFGRWLLGCDDCQEVCPHNHAPPIPDEPDLEPRHAWLHCDVLLTTPDEALMQRFLGTPLRRPGAAGLKRNACIVLGNIGDDRAVDPLRSHGLTHPSPVVRGAAVWALAELGAPPETVDDDPIVMAERDAL